MTIEIYFSMVIKLASAHKSLKNATWYQQAWNSSKLTFSLGTDVEFPITHECNIWKITGVSEFKKLSDLQVRALYLHMALNKSWVTDRYKKLETWKEAQIDKLMSKIPPAPELPTSNDEEGVY